MPRRLIVEAAAIIGGSLLISLLWIVVATAGKPTVAAAVAAPTSTPATVALAPTPRPTADFANSTPLPTVRPVFTITPVPTAVPATSTAPAQAAKPAGPSPEVVAYINWLRPRVETGGKALHDLSTQTDQASRNPVLILEKDWRMKTAVALGVMSVTGKEMRSYPETVPPEAAKLDGIMKSLGGDMEYVATEYAAGIDNPASQRMNNAVTRMRGFSAKTQAASAEIEALGRS